MRLQAIAIALCFFSIASTAQENNPLINSGELISKANKLHDEGNYKESINLLRQIPRGDTNYYLATYELAFSLMLDSQFVAAKKTCEEGLATANTNWPDFYTLYGNLVDDMGDPQRALRIYDSAFALYPDKAELLLNKGTTLMKLERYADAEEVFKKSILINPYLASSHYKLGACALQQGRVMQAFLSHINYLLLQPSGRFQSNSINSLSLIGQAGDDIKALIQKRPDEAGNSFATVEKIVLSKIALDKQYKPLMKLDDPIPRQIQVFFEKVEYDESDPDFWMQYYVPLFKAVFEEKKFEDFIYRLFANVQIQTIQDYIKKNKKSIEAVVDMAVAYYNQLRATRELNYTTRKEMSALYHHDNGKLFGKGKTKDNGEKLVGDWEFYFSPGNLSSKGSYDENGERTGTWLYYHFNGKLRGKQQFKDAKLNGEEIFYFENGAIASVTNYKNGVEDGLYKSNYLVGTPKVTVEYKDGKVHGERKLYSSNGFIQSIESYKNDSLSGPFKTYHKTGPLESEGNYTNGKLEGLYKSYFEDGRLSMEGMYSNGTMKGLWKQYHENGKLKLQQTYNDGVAEGEYIEYYDNGQLFYKCIYKNGKASGIVDYMDKDGKKFFTYAFENDVVKVARYFDKTGKEIGVSERKAKRLDLTSYYSDGYKRSQAVYNDKAEIVGLETYFYRSGKISSEYSYNNGKLNGPGTNYYANGNKQSSTYYKEGERHGYEKFWYSHGQPEEEGWYQDGMIEGTWRSYDEMGNLSYLSPYLNNDLNGYREEFFPDGKKNNEMKYRLGWVEEFIQFDTTGNIINRCELKNGNGKFKVVFFNGKTFGEGTYVNGQLDGVYKFYYFDGKLNTQQFYEKGYLDSSFRNYYYNGKASTEGQYTRGKKTGTWKYYLENGKTNYIEHYIAGELTGKKTYYFENGKTDTEIEYEKGEKNGWTKKYDADGSLMYQVLFKDDIPVTYTYLDKTGKLVPEIAIPGGTGRVKTYFSNGKVSSDFGYAEGKLHGENIAYHTNGKLRFSGVEDYGLSEGVYKYYFPNGQVQNEYVFKYNSLHGPYKEYNEKGVLVEEGVYYNDLPHHIFKRYDDGGKLTETRYYYYGKLLDLKK